MPRPSAPTPLRLPTAFDVDLRRESVIVCTGELDLAAAPALRSAFLAATRRRDDVVLDLGQVTFLDCSAVGEVVRADVALHGNGRELTTRGMGPAARRLFALVGVDLAESDRPTPPADGAASAPRATAAEMVESWRAACLTGTERSDALAFEDPVDLLARINAAVTGPTRSVPAATLAEIVRSCTPTEDGDPATAVMQLIALGGVMRGEETALGRHESRLDVVIDALVSAAVRALVDIGLVDPLTGLRNRRALDQDPVQFLAAARRRGQCLSVVMIDIEGLKAVNDRLGHAAGDEVLRGVATNLAATSRAGDQAYRFGGDEFVLLLPDLCPDDIDGMMRRTTEGTSASFTWGCAWVEDGDDTGGDLGRAEELLRLADRRMLDFRQRVRGSRRAHAGRDQGDERVADVRDADELAGQIAAGGRDNALVAQATGMLAQYFGAAMADAGDLLRSSARFRGETVDVTAGLLVDGSLRAESLTARPGDRRGSGGELSGTTGGTRGP